AATGPRVARDASAFLGTKTRRADFLLIQGRSVRLIVENLACRRSGRRIFSGLSFTVGRGEGLMVTGRNGAGKSTLLTMLAGRLKPDGGSIRAEGIGEASLPECLHVIGHRDGLKSALTAEENLGFAR